MGPTCAGKSTIINRLLTLSNKIGAVQIGKLMRSKYGAAHFKGQAAPEHTKDEALQMYFDEIEKQISIGKQLILVDGQPRDIDQAKIMTEAWKEHDVKFFLVTADHEIREQRAQKDREPGPNLDLAISRLTNDYKSNYTVICELIKRGIPITVIDTSIDFNVTAFCDFVVESLEDSNMSSFNV